LVWVPPKQDRKVNFVDDLKKHHWWSREVRCVINCFISVGPGEPWKTVWTVPLGKEAGVFKHQCSPVIEGCS
jgi:hypothetical protein